MKRKVYKSSKDKVFFGVLGGIAERYNTVPSLVRIIYCLLTAFTAVIPGLLVYILMGVFMKKDPLDNVDFKEYLQNRKEMANK